MTETTNESKLIKFSMLVPSVKEMEPMAISTSEAARLLGVSRPTIYKLIHRNDFPVFHVGTRTMISVEGLRKWVEKQTGAGDRQDMR